MNLDDNKEVLRYQKAQMLELLLFDIVLGGRAIRFTIKSLRGGR